MTARGILFLVTGKVSIDTGSRKLIQKSAAHKSTLDYKTIVRHFPQIVAVTRPFQTEVNRVRLSFSYELDRTKAVLFFYLKCK